MNDIVPLFPLSSSALPALVTAAGDRAGIRFPEFFAAQIHNPHTRCATRGLWLTWCQSQGVLSLTAV
jgi:hypothetical protein